LKDYQARNSQDLEAIVDLGDSWIHYFHLLMHLSGYDQMTDCGGGEMVTAVLD
jgi:ssRNA-specific RNase YbeY (16S rRNA maturation enzyme)